MDSFTPLWSKLVNSSIWSEAYPVRILWTTMLAVKDRDHVVRYSAYALAQMAKMPEQEVLDALKILSEPDTRRIEPQPFEGRRIERVEDGWLILNGEEYQKKMQMIFRRARNAEAMRDARERARNHRRVDNQPTMGERVEEKESREG